MMNGRLMAKMLRNITDVRNCLNSDLEYSINKINLFVTDPSNDSPSGRTSNSSSACLDWKG